MPRKPDPLESEIERAFRPGAYVEDRACLSFVTGLEAVNALIAPLIGSDPSRATALLETFIAACCEKAEEIDDSTGWFGQFIEDLCCSWVEARQAAGADARETARSLLAWMDHDAYGFFYGLERYVEAVMDKENRSALVQAIRDRFDAAARPASPAKGARFGNPEADRRRWGEALRVLYAAQKAATAYEALAAETGLTVPDCQVLASLWAGRNQPRKALAWIERGIELDRQTARGMDGHYMAMFRRELLIKLGRGEEALEEAWGDYRERPGKYTYDELMKFVPKAERPQWHAKAIEASGKADLDSAMELFLATGETERLAERVLKANDEELESLSHYTTEPAARVLEKTRPDLGARLWRAQGMRIVKAGKSKYYAAALSNFERAKRCYEQAGLAADWQRTVDRVRADHARKTGFMPGFERLAAGRGPGGEPSFLKRAKAHWDDRQRRRK
ncbi:MAG: hypothetical protein KA419_13970 [Acidobacteria bacterium]|nr:hypothetical protein [Acidobacteriota bacterium]